MTKTTTQNLQENCQLVAHVLAVNTNLKQRETFIEEKDVLRVRNIYKKDESKWLRDCELMANKITDTEKAVRRAKAIIYGASITASDEIVSRMTRVFLRRAVMLHLGELDAQDIVKLRIAGAISTK